MKNLVLIGIIVLTILAISSCADDEIRTEPCETLNYECFVAYLKTDMTYDQITNTFGEPHEDLGSGIHIYAYNLDDGTTMYIGFTNQILYAVHVDQEERLLHELI